MTGGQGQFEYTDEVLAVIEKYLSPERLATYISMARGDKWTAIKLYERNTELSEALYGVCQGLEVALRNAIHNVLSAQLGTQEWYDEIDLEPSERDAVEEAKEKLRETGQKTTPGRMVAELTFGFWTKLLSATYEKTLWVKYLYRIFPIKTRRTSLFGRLLQLKTLRNRIAHHERILGKRDLRQDYADLIEAIGWISKDVRAWVESTNCFEKRAAQPAPKKPKPHTAEPEAAKAPTEAASVKAVGK